MGPQGLVILPEIFDICTAPEIRNTENCFKNADDILAGGKTLKELDKVMRRILTVCQTRGIKLAPSKLQVGRRLRWGGVMVESVGHREGRSDVLISPDQAKLDEFLDLERPKSKKDVQQLCGLAAQMKKFERLYEGCESCLNHARSKPHKNNARCEVLPASLKI